MLTDGFERECLCYDGWRSVVVRPSLSGAVGKVTCFLSCFLSARLVQLIFWYDLVFFQSCTVNLNESRMLHRGLQKITVDKLLDVHVRQISK
jgi:hypothetical protein